MASTLLLHRAIGLNTRLLLVPHNVPCRSLHLISLASPWSRKRDVSLPLTDRSPPSIILQFTKNKIWNATHRDSQPRFSPSSRPSSPSRKSPSLRPSLFPRSPRRGPGFVESLPPGFIFWGILVVNGLVFLLWQYSISQYKSGNPSWVRAMSKNFLASVRNFKEGRIWTILTCCFSQSDTTHLMVNAFTYFFMARPVLMMLGNARFLTLYLGGGILSSCISMLWSNLVKNETNHSSHGASGAIYAIISFFACMRPTARFLIFGIIPCPAWAFVTMIFVYDSLRALGNRQTQTDTAGHVGGLLAGMAYFVARRIGRL